MATVRRNWPSTMQVSMNLFLNLKDVVHSYFSVRWNYLCMYLYILLNKLPIIGFRIRQKGLSLSPEGYRRCMVLPMSVLGTLVPRGLVCVSASLALSEHCPPVKISHVTE